MAISSSDHPRFLPAPGSGGSSREHYLNLREARQREQQLIEELQNSITIDSKAFHDLDSRQQTATADRRKSYQELQQQLRYLVSPATTNDPEYAWIPLSGPLQA